MNNTEIIEIITNNTGNVFGYNEYNFKKFKNILFNWESGSGKGTFKRGFLLALSARTNYNLQNIPDDLPSQILYDTNLNESKELIFKEPKEKFKKVIADQFNTLEKEIFNSYYAIVFENKSKQNFIFSLTMPDTLSNYLVKYFILFNSIEEINNFKLKLKNIYNDENFKDNLKYILKTSNLKFEIYDSNKQMYSYPLTKKNSQFFIIENSVFEKLIILYSGLMTIENFTSIPASIIFEKSKLPNEDIEIINNNISNLLDSIEDIKNLSGINTELLNEVKQKILNNENILDKENLKEKLIILKNMIEKYKNEKNEFDKSYHFKVDKINEQLNFLKENYKLLTDKKDKIINNKNDFENELKIIKNKKNILEKKVNINELETKTFEEINNDILIKIEKLNNIITTYNNKKEFIENNKKQLKNIKKTIKDHKEHKEKNDKLLSKLNELKKDFNPELNLENKNIENLQAEIKTINNKIIINEEKIKTFKEYKEKFSKCEINECVNKVIQEISESVFSEEEWKKVEKEELLKIEYLKEIIKQLQLKKEIFDIEEQITNNETYILTDEELIELEKTKKELVEFERTISSLKDNDIKHNQIEKTELETLVLDIFNKLNFNNYKELNAYIDDLNVKILELQSKKTEIENKIEEELNLKDELNKELFNLANEFKNSKELVIESKIEEELISIDNYDIDIEYKHNNLTELYNDIIEKIEEFKNLCNRIENFYVNIETELKRFNKLKFNFENFDDIVNENILYKLDNLYNLNMEISNKYETTVMEDNNYLDIFKHNLESIKYLKTNIINKCFNVINKLNRELKKHRSISDIFYEIYYEDITFEELENIDASIQRIFNINNSFFDEDIITNIDYKLLLNKNSERTVDLNSLEENCKKLLTIFNSYKNYENYIINIIKNNIKLIPSYGEEKADPSGGNEATIINFARIIFLQILNSDINMPFILDEVQRSDVKDILHHRNNLTNLYFQQGIVDENIRKNCDIIFDTKKITENILIYDKKRQTGKRSIFFVSNINCNIMD